MAERITDILVSNEIIIAENRNLYAYGLQQGLLMIFNIATIMGIGIVLNMVWESIIFLLTFIPLRSNTGGYHAKTQLRCYLYSVAMITATLMGIKIIPWTGIICIALTLVAGMIIFFLAPVEAVNKPLGQVEKAVYKKRTRFFLVLFVFLVLLFCYIGQLAISVCIMMGNVVVGIVLVLGRVKLS
ncbi:accessory gene regulator B family protein [Acetobacterium sp.]|jgi:accessory gene regulator B|uniref:accessory gene regulator B family protein n=1 Tax=Acetobacterium sp. TaxID=1872094 RepID=UPI0026BFCF57|nr:accessory gene regulator B family protein [Acetobacterium sp.]MDO9492053.1 accessory gene regulator B family protein [Acetobacterium sp.]